MGSGSWGAAGQGWGVRVAAPGRARAQHRALCWQQDSAGAGGGTSWQHPWCRSRPPHGFSLLSFPQGIWGGQNEGRCRALSSPQPSVPGRVAAASRPWCGGASSWHAAPSAPAPVLRLPVPVRGTQGARGQLGAPPARCCRGLEALGSGAGETLPRRAASQGAAGSGDWRGPSSPQLVGSSPLPKSCSGRILHAAGSCSCPAGGLCSAPPKLPLPWDLGSRQCHGDHGTHGAPGARVASPPLSCCGGSGRWGGRGGAQKGSAVTTAPDLSPAVCSGAGRAFARFPGELRVYGFPVVPFPVIGSASLIPLIDAGGRGIQPPGHPLGGFGGVAPSGGV